MSFAHSSIRFSNSPAGLAAFHEHIAGPSVGSMSWAKGITLHHTAAPSLASRPGGLSPQHILNIQDYYQHKLGWSTGPHLFVDDHGVYCLTPLRERGTHAKSFNATHIGIEVLGDYDTEDPHTGRGLACWQHAARIVYAIGLRYNFHRDDPKTDKTCPGKRVQKDWFNDLIRDAEHYDTANKTNTTSTEADGTQPRLLLSGFPDIRQLPSGGTIIAPIADTLRRIGIDGAYDSGNWEGLKVLYYDQDSETSYASLRTILESFELPF